MKEEIKLSYITTKNRFIEVNKQQIAYRILNEPAAGKPLVMLTHLAATMDNWDSKLIDLLAQSRTIIVVDLPGVGESQGKVATSIEAMAKQALDFIESLGYEKIDLLGLSMGGMIAQELVRLKSELVDHLILVGTAPRGGLEVDQVTKKTFKYMLKAMVTFQDPKRYIFYPHDKHGRKIAQTILNKMKSRTKENRDQPMKVTSFMRQLKAINAWGKKFPDDLEFIKQQTLIVNGDKDMEVPTQNSYQMHEKIANSQLIIYKHAGHGSIFQYADEFVQSLNGFLEN